MDEIAVLARFHAQVAAPAAAVTAASRAGLLREPATRARAQRRRRVLLIVAIALCAFAAAAAFAAVDILDGPPAPAADDAALQHLFPPLGIGHARALAATGDRTLFGARTTTGGYCFSATSPGDPKAEGGHCLSAAGTARLSAGRMTGFPISGGTIAGYAPGAASVHLHGLGLNETLAVENNGWWVGDASSVYSLHTPAGLVMATALDGNGNELASAPVIRVWHPDVEGTVAFTEP